jgi:hypothetical protein
MVTCITPRTAKAVNYSSSLDHYVYFSNLIVDPSPDSLVVHLNVSFPAPTVILDHSMFIANVVLNGSTATVTFTTLTALQYAYQHWNPYPELLLVTDAVSSDPQRDYLLVTSPTWSDATLSVSFTAELQHPSDTFHEFTVNWGGVGNQGKSENNNNGHSGNGPPENGHPGNGPPENGHPGNGPPGNNGPSRTSQSSTSPTTRSSTATTIPTACSKPAAPVIGGLPAAPCGYYFDKTLDQNIGY